MNIDSYNQGTILGYKPRKGPYVSNGNTFNEGLFNPFGEQPANYLSVNATPVDAV